MQKKYDTDSKDSKNKQRTVRGKTKEQKEALNLLYRMYRGVQPGKEKLEELSKPLGLTVVQIQKWFWDKNQNDIQEMAQAQVLLKQRMEQEEASARQDEATFSSPAKTCSEF